MSDFTPGEDEPPIYPVSAPFLSTGAGTPPADPPARRSNLALAGVIVALLALMFTGIGIAVHGMRLSSTTTGPTAAAILQRAAAARLDDTSFTINQEQDLGVGDASNGGVAITVTSTGKGMFTRVPSRLQVIINPIGGSAFGASATEYIYDDSDLYVRLPTSLFGKSKKPWLKIASDSNNGLSNLFAATINQATITGYALIENPTLVADSTTFAGRKTWHIHGTVPAANSLGLLAGASANVVSTEDLWLAQDTLLPLQIVIHQTTNLTLYTGTAGGATTETTKTTTTLAFTAWNTGIRIALPPPSQVTTQLPTPPLPPTSTPTPTP